MVLTAAATVPAQAQSIRVDVRDEPLEDVLLQLRTQAGVDIVFASRLVEGRTTTCHYLGGEPLAALECVLRDTGIRAERVRHRQYVLVADASDEHQEAREAAPAARGMVAGFVVDAETGERLPGAHVYLTELKVGTVTNDAGYFAIASLPLRHYAVRISYLGYETLVADLPADTVSTTIRLRPIMLQTADVVVEGNADRTSDVTTVPGVVAVPINQLERLPSFPGERDLFQALQWFAGVQKVGDISGGLVVRGGEPDQNLYLLDGAPIYHPWHVFSLISTFQTETLRDIKLYRGAFPAEYGGRLSAVLDAQMKDGTRVRPRAVAALSLISGRFLIETPVTRNSSFMVSGRRSYIDKLIGREHPVEADDGRRDTLRTGYYFYDTSAKYVLRSGTRHRFSLSFYEGGDNLDLRLPFNLSLDRSWLRPADLFFEIQQNWRNQLFSFRYQYLYAHRLFLTLTAYQSSYRAAEGAFLRPTGTSDLRSDYDVELTDIGFRGELDYYHSVSHQFRIGLQLVDRRFESGLQAKLHHSPAAADSLEQQSRLHAPEVVLHLQDTWQPGPRWTVQPGVRASFFGDGRYAHVDPGLNVQYVLVPDRLIARGGVGTQVQYLHRLRDRYSILYDLVSSRWIPAGSGIRPSTSAQATVGLESHPRKGLAISSDVYVRRSKDILLPEDEYRTKDGLAGPGIEVGTLLGQYTTGRGLAYGVELSLHAEQGKWHAWLNYAGGRSLNRAPELDENAYRPARFDVPRAFRGVIQRDGRRIDVTLSAELRSGYPHSVPVSRYVVGDPLGEAGDAPEDYLHRPRINNGRLPPYVRADLGFAWKFRALEAKWQAQLHLYNVTNYRSVVSRQYEPTPEGVVVTDRRGFPILPLFEIQMEL